MQNKTIMDQLKEEHIEVRDLLAKAEKCPTDERSEMVEKIKKELIPHARGEEKSVYAILRERLDNEDGSMEDITLTEEAYEEHKAMDAILEDLETLSPSSQKWLGRLQVLKENIQHHIEEEEDKLFELIQRQFSEEECRNLNEAYLELKEDYKTTLPSQSQIKERQPSPIAKDLAG